MTLQNLNKILDKYDLQFDGTTISNQLEQLKGLPFYSDWFLSQRLTQKDFNHAIGLPQKNGSDYPLFDYEQLVFNALQNHKHVWIKKATGLGIRVFAQVYGMA